MEANSLNPTLSELLRGHNVAHEESGGWLAPYGQLPAIRANWYPKDGSGVLQIDVLLQDKRIIEECFAGFGEGERAIADAFQNFCVNSFHVMLAAFWNIKDENQVTIEAWEIGAKHYTAYIGNFGRRCIDDCPPEPPTQLFMEWENAIKSEVAQEKMQDTSWFRFYFGDIRGDQIFEALKENQVWGAGLTALKSMHWEKSQEFYSVRNFMILKERVSERPGTIKRFLSSLSSGFRHKFGHQQ
ncbi:DUF6348 family protein [Undibacterium cyanobacteriorum]|uniref:DUF6348 family protein n=1 Tax=Undibacterium cyanobacteriorum TaxID=3073561 RepID=A0ABY9RFW0_9BURK|nr:DUF6348 family protein [Undibacterium sp. 20NA77.5]WMW80099.1 DUF6348 family protein [Undibacterium sp. 20NA77.5]